MRQSEKKKEKNKIAIVLMLCFSVMALTSIFTIKSGIDKINQSVPDLPVSEETKSEDSGEVTSTTPAQDNTTQSSQVSSSIPTVDSLEPDIIPHTFVFPVNEPNAKITNPYSMDKLIYSVTLDQYMTHSGVDIEAPEDTQVLAIAAHRYSFCGDNAYPTGEKHIRSYPLLHLLLPVVPCEVCQ